MSAPPLRSMLFVPANRTAWVDKAVTAGADAVVLDLEDAVPAGQKVAARDEVAGLLARGTPPVPVVVRVNGLQNRRLLDDLTAVVGRTLTAVMMPKVASVADVVVVDRLLGWLEADAELAPGAIRLIPVLETAAGIRSAYDIARASSRCAYMGGLGVKGGDIERSLGTAGPRKAVRPSLCGARC